MQLLVKYLCLYLDMLERLVEQDITTRVAVLENDLPGEETFPPHPRPFQLDPASQRQLDQDAAPEAGAGTELFNTEQKLNYCLTESN